MDYLTKLPEAFATPDQKAETIAPLFLEHIVCRHSIPEELLSDRGTNFLSNLMQEICQVMGVKKINTSGYHPQTDGHLRSSTPPLWVWLQKVRLMVLSGTLVFRMYSAYRASLQEYTKESLFFLYGRPSCSHFDCTDLSEKSIYNQYRWLQVQNYD